MTVWRDWLIIPSGRAGDGSRVLDAIARAHGLTVAHLKGPSTVQRIASARHEAMRVLRDEHYWTLTQIGRLLRRDHTTVIYGVQRARERTLCG